MIHLLLFFGLVLQECKQSAMTKSYGTLSQAGQVPEDPDSLARAGILVVFITTANLYVFIPPSDLPHELDMYIKDPGSSLICNSAR
jgi:hypothetical protein